MLIRLMTRRAACARAYSFSLTPRKLRHGKIHQMMQVRTAKTEAPEEDRKRWRPNRNGTSSHQRINAWFVFVAHAIDYPMSSTILLASSATSFLSPEAILASINFVWRDESNHRIDGIL